MCDRGGEVLARWRREASSSGTSTASHDLCRLTSSISRLLGSAGDLGFAVVQLRSHLPTRAAQAMEHMHGNRRPTPSADARHGYCLKRLSGPAGPNGRRLDGCDAGTDWRHVLERRGHVARLSLRSKDSPAAARIPFSMLPSTATGLMPGSLTAPPVAAGTWAMRQRPTDGRMGLLRPAARPKQPKVGRTGWYDGVPGKPVIPSRGRDSRHTLAVSRVPPIRGR